MRPPERQRGLLEKERERPTINVIPAAGTGQDAAACAAVTALRPGRPTARSRTAEAARARALLGAGGLLGAAERDARAVEAPLGELGAGSDAGKRTGSVGVSEKGSDGGGSDDQRARPSATRLGYRPPRSELEF